MRQDSEAGFKKLTHECCQHCFKGCRSARSAFRCSDHTPHTATSRFTWSSSQKEASSEAGSQKASKQFAQDNLVKSMNYWNHVLRSDESKVNLFDSDGVQHVWRRPGDEYQENCALPTVKNSGGSIMVWGCMTTACTGELQFIEGNMDSNITTTPNTLPRWLLPCCWRLRWWSGQVCLQTWTILSICGRHPQAEGGEASKSSMMSLWRSERGCQHWLL